MQDGTRISPHIAIRRSRWGLQALRALGLLAGAVCTQVLAGTLVGTALYRERIALPPDAVFEAVLEDVSRADAPARVLGRARLDPAGNPPFHFEIAYDEAAVQAGHRYVVRATVTQQGRVWFTTDRSYPVFDGQSAPLSLLLVAAPASAAPAVISGLFIYMADAGVITLCADGSRLPVAKEGDFRALEAAYLQARPAPGEALLARVAGTIATRPSMEESAPPRDTLVVERFISVSRHATCSGAQKNRPLRGTNWKLVRLGAAPVEVRSGQAEPQLVFANDALQVSGSGGCNRITGGFTIAGDRLHLGPLVGTMMACVNGMEQEQHFLKALDRVERYRISGQQLELLDASGAVLARFEAAALR